VKNTGDGSVHDLAAWVTWFARNLDLRTPVNVIGCSLGASLTVIGMPLTMLDTGDCAGFTAGERDGHHLQNRGEATALILEVGTRGPAEPHAEVAVSVLVRSTRLS